MSKQIDNAEEIRKAFDDGERSGYEKACREKDNISKNHKEALEIHREYMRSETDLSYPAWIEEQIKKEGE